MNTINLILFDLDGTLVDAAADITQAVNTALRTQGLPPRSISQIQEYMGGSVEDLMRKSMAPVQDAHALDALLDYFKQYFREHSADRSVLYPGTRETLDYFRDIPKALVTNRTREMAVPTLLKLGIQDYFSAIVTGDDPDCLKPNACPVDRGIAALNADKNRTLFVGDMPVDIQAGRSAGVKTCGVTYGVGKKEDIQRAAPDYIIDSITDLRTIIN